MNPKTAGTPQLNQIVARTVVLDPGSTERRIQGTTTYELQHSSTTGSHLYSLFGKRTLDACAALMGLVVTGPILFLSAVAIWLDSPGPIFYRQWRVGQRGRPFRIFKFRTMIDGADEQASKVTAAGDRRITRIGKFLRKTKLDELPQLLNVLRGEMSLVGPRPEVPEYTLKYTSQERAVLELKPGITGPASLAYIDEGQLLSTAVNPEDFYINTLMRRKLEVDLAYCRKVSFLEDVQIILLTVGTLIASMGRRVTLHVQ